MYLRAILATSGSRILATVGLYLCFGVLFFTSFETKPCESLEAQAQHRAAWIAQQRRPHWLQRKSAYDASGCIEPWPHVDALYFCMVSMSTVGYGDLAPSTWLSRCFTLAYILVGVTVVFYELSSELSGLLMSARMLALRVLDRFDAAPANVAGRSLGLSGHGLDINGDGMADFVLPPSAVIFWTQARCDPMLSPSPLDLPQPHFHPQCRLSPHTTLALQEVAFIAGLMIITQLASASLFVVVEPSITFHDALYHCIISATTVGYGDVRLSQQPARLWAVIHVLFSTSWLHFSTLADTYSLSDS